MSNVNMNSSEEKIRNFVMADLDPRPLVAHTKLGLATVLGGILSLTVCGQFGIGFTEFAVGFTEKMHESMHPLSCALICGALYSIFPVAILRIMLTPPMQFKAIMTRRKAFVAVWFLGFGGLTAVFGHHGNQLMLVGAWILAALATTQVLALVSELLIPSWSPPVLVER